MELILLPIRRTQSNCSIKVFWWQVYVLLECSNKSVHHTSGVMGSDIRGFNIAGLTINKTNILGDIKSSLGA